MVKLFRKTRSVIEYWEVWKDGNRLVVHFGVVGDRGGWHLAEKPPIEREDDTIERLSDDIKKKGFAESPPSGFVDLVIQYPIAEFTSEEDAEKRHRMEEILDEELGWTGNGECVGGDIGAGEVSIYCKVIDTGAAIEAVWRTFLDNDYPSFSIDWQE
jgi:hypothetical protein